MALASANATYDELHEGMPYHDGRFKSWAKERGEQTPFHYRDGVTIWVASADLTPDDDFLGDGPLADKSPDDDGNRPEGDVDPRALKH
jgi:hypothetical protein